MQDRKYSLDTTFTMQKCNLIDNIEEELSQVQIKHFQELADAFSRDGVIQEIANQYLPTGEDQRDAMISLFVDNADEIFSTIRSQNDDGLPLDSFYSFCYECLYRYFIILLEDVFYNDIKTALQTYDKSKGFFADHFYITNKKN